MVLAAHAYPAGYDWPYQTISVLLYADQNPHGYLWGCAGLELCGLAGIVWTAQATRDLRRATDQPLATGLRLLQAGFVCMCCAVLPDRLLPWSKGHEAFAILAFLGVCVGLTWQVSVVFGSRTSYSDGRMPRRTSTTIRRVMPLLPLVPLVLAGLTQAYLALVRTDLPWVTPRWRTLGISPFLSFGLWEWISSAALSVCLLLLWSHIRAICDQQ
jgi:hypothetical protein